MPNFDHFIENLTAKNPGMGDDEGTLKIRIDKLKVLLRKAFDAGSQNRKEF